MWSHLSDVSSGKESNAIDSPIITKSLLRHVIVSHGDGISAHPDLSARVWLIRAPIVALRPVDQPNLAALDDGADFTCSRVVQVLTCRCAARLCETVRLHHRAKAHLSELVHVLVQD